MIGEFGLSVVAALASSVRAAERSFSIDPTIVAQLRRGPARVLIAVLVLERRHGKAGFSNPLFLTRQFGFGEGHFVLARPSRQVVDHLVARLHDGRGEDLGEDRIEGLDLDVEVAAEPLRDDYVRPEIVEERLA